MFFAFFHFNNFFVTPGHIQAIFNFWDPILPELSNIQSPQHFIVWQRISKISRCWTTLTIWQISNTLDLQNFHMFIINPMIPMANTKLGIEFEHVNMLKIQSVWNSSDAFAVILPQQRPVLVSAHAQNFLSWSLAKETLQGIANCPAPKTVIGVTKVANERYLPYLKLCGNT